MASLNVKFIKIIHVIAQKVSASLKKGGRVLICGNGGSAADAQHFAAELVGGYTNHNRAPLDVIALSTNTSNLTAIGNDYRYEDIFSRQVEAHARKGDVVIGISTSGNSANVVEAIKVAKKKGVLSVVLTGASGGKMRALADLTLRAPSDSTPRIQEAHIVAIHSVCELVERSLFGPQADHRG
ncbi:MAG: SIS domain-containing protein [Elusimicrobiota bacterium]